MIQRGRTHAYGLFPKSEGGQTDGETKIEIVLPACDELREWSRPI